MNCRLLFVTLSIFSINSIISAQWTQDLSMNLPICVQPNDQTNPIIISDGSGGAIILWADKRDGDIDFYAQRVTFNGQIAWQENGVPIQVSRGDLLNHKMVENGNGGAYISWIANDRIYAQQINSDGQLMWNQPISISSLTEIQHSNSMASDLNGGFIMALISGSKYSWNNLIVQRVNSDGNLIWGGSGKTIISHSNSRYPEIVSTSDGGAIIFYELGWVNYDYYLQIIDKNGTKTLSADGTHIGPHDGTHNIISDGSNGAIITWEYKYEIFANRINNSGSKLWGENNIVVCTASTEKFTPRLISDGNFGAYIAWYDAINAGYDPEDLYAQHINSSGQRLWPSDGIMVADGKVDKFIWYYKLTTDNNGGLIISWETNPKIRYPSGVNPHEFSDFVWVKQMDFSGNAPWADGVKLSTNSAKKHSISTISDNQGGIIGVWVDKRNGNDDIFAQRVDSNTVTCIKNKIVERNPCLFNLYPNYPNPFNLNTNIRYDIPKDVNVELKILNISGQLVKILVNEYKSAGSYITSWDGTNTKNQKLPSGIYLIQIKAGGFTNLERMLLIK